MSAIADSRIPGPIPPAQKPAPSIVNVSCEKRWLNIRWEDGRESCYPYLFLKDNAPGSRHSNGQKLAETSALSPGLHPTRATLSHPGELDILWPDGSSDKYPAQWLQANDLSYEALAARKTAGQQYNPPRLWDASINADLPRANYPDLKNDRTQLASWLGHVRQYGFALLHNTPLTPNTVLEIIALFGYPKETNYGRLFDVRTVVNPNNLAYTGLGISGHTDNPYRDPTPTLQLLHCLSSDADGGDSVLADGFAIARDLLQKNPHYFELLANTPVTFRFRDGDNWLERTTPIINLDINGDPVAIRFNNRSIQPFELAPAKMLAFYDAYLCFAGMINDPHYHAQFKMTSGDCYIVDNERILHARSAFDNKNGERWLQGAYSDRDGLLSRWRVLTHKPG